MQGNGVRIPMLAQLTHMHIRSGPFLIWEGSLLTCHLGGSGEGSSFIQRQVLRHYSIPVTPCNTCDSGEYFPSPSLPQRGNLSSHLVPRIERTGSLMAAPISYCIGMTDKHGFLPWLVRWMDGESKQASATGDETNIRWRAVILVHSFNSFSQ
jgi:hypothetical protein